MTLAILAGRGDLPKMIIEKCKKTNRDFFLILLEGEKTNVDFFSYPHHIVHIGHTGKILKILRDNKASEIVFAGGINKPSMANMKVDGKGAILLSKILGAKLFGDDNVLSTVMNFFEKEGFKFIGVEEIIDDLVARAGIIGVIKPEKDFWQDIEIGKRAIKTISELDIGQAVAIQQKQIIGVEAIEGTDALIERCGKVQFPNGRKPVLVKMKKAGQNTKVDLPSLGVQTIENLHKAGFAGIAVEAGSALIINQKEVIRVANEYGVFLVGI
jgi:DUF1009 family protein